MVGLAVVASGEARVDSLVLPLASAEHGPVVQRGSKGVNRQFSRFAKVSGRHYTTIIIAETCPELTNYEKISQWVEIFCPRARKRKPESKAAPQIDRDAARACRAHVGPILTAVNSAARPQADHRRHGILQPSLHRLPLRPRLHAGPAVVACDGENAARRCSGRRY